MTRALALLLALALPAAPTTAQRISTADTGALALAYAGVTRQAGFDGQPLLAEVTHRPGEAVSVITPYRVQQIRYRVDPGAEVAAGEVIAELAGPEVHHFMQEYEVAGQRLEIARRRYQSNRDLYRSQAIGEARWSEISEAFFEASLAYEHMRHFRDLVRPAEDDDHAVLLTAPAAGLVHFTRDRPGVAPGGELMVIIPRAVLRLRVSVPLERRGDIAALATGACTAAVASVDGVAERYFAEAWSEPIDPGCGLVPGQWLQVTPHYRGNFCVIPGPALLRHEGGNAVFLRDGDALVLEPVTLVGSSEAGYVVRCGAELDGREVLVSSVSAVQGMLLGLGGE